MAATNQHDRRRTSTASIIHRHRNRYRNRCRDRNQL